MITLYYVVKKDDLVISFDLQTGIVAEEDRTTVINFREGTKTFCFKCKTERDRKLKELNKEIQSC